MSQEVFKMAFLTLTPFINSTVRNALQH